MVSRSFAILLLAGFFLLGLGTFQEAVAQKTSGRTVEHGGTVFLDDPVLLREQPMLLALPSPTPSPTASPRPTPSASAPISSPHRPDSDRVPAPPSPLPRAPTQASAPANPRSTPIYTPQPRMDPDEEDLLLRQARRFRTLAPPVGAGTGGFSVNSGSGLFVGQTIPVPVEYAPARVSQTVAPGATTTVVVPSTPTRFAPVETGVSFGGGGFRSRELSGFVDYSSPIRTLAPVYDAQGRPVGYRVIETPNRILQPVFRSIEVR